MELTINKPFVTNTGEVVTMKAVVTIRDKATLKVQQHYAVVHQNNNRYFEDELIPMSDVEYTQHLQRIADESNS